ncbi:uncharacterized protein LOC122320330 [Drosophila ficusphila]|uniref:uncharacterized protein LOC122320330 n=1 Tax=Drosophila ficusphila TaxID=30025 RepID=UPI001C896093|nr:uncharacterized protein LOC122320330 [Drosophila ficusphila]
MPCDCSSCKRKVAAGLKDPNEEPKVRWAPRMPSHSPLRQRDELRRSESPLPGPSGAHREGGRRHSRIRVKKRMRVCIHTASGSAHGRALGGRCENCKAPTPTSGGQRAPNRRRAGDGARRDRGGDELPAARRAIQRSQRRRSANTRAPADRRAAIPHPSTPDPGPGGSQLLAAMATCLQYAVFFEGLGYHQQIIQVHKHSTAQSLWDHLIHHPT